MGQGGGMAGRGEGVDWCSDMGTGSALLGTPGTCPVVLHLQHLPAGFCVLLMCIVCCGAAAGTEPPPLLAAAAAACLARRRCDSCFCDACGAQRLRLLLCGLGCSAAKAHVQGAVERAAMEPV